MFVFSGISRYKRLQGDRCSDVCSSDLAVKALAREAAQRRGQDLAPARLDVLLSDLRHTTSILALTANGRYSITNEHSFSIEPARKSVVYRIVCCHIGRHLGTC